MYGNRYQRTNRIGQITNQFQNELQSINLLFAFSEFYCKFLCYLYLGHFSLKFFFN